MTLWQPKNRAEWWLAFAGALLVLAPAVSFGGIGIAQSLNAAQLSWVGPLAAPLPAAYLVLVSRLRSLWKFLLVPPLAVIVAFACVPRSSCGNKDQTPNPLLTEHVEVRGCNG
jgi:hypothetical protein